MSLMYLKRLELIIQVRNIKWYESVFTCTRSKPFKKLRHDNLLRYNFANLLPRMVTSSRMYKS